MNIYKQVFMIMQLFNYTMGNKYNNPLDTRNYRLSVPREINVVSHSLNKYLGINSILYSARKKYCWIKWLS